MALQIRRGTNSERTAVTLSAGELGYTTDTKKLYVGDGTTAGGVEVGGGSSAPNFAVAIATTEGFGLGDWQKSTVGNGSVVVLRMDNGSAATNASGRSGVLTLRTASVNDIASIGGQQDGVMNQLGTFSPLFSSSPFTRLTAFICVSDLPNASDITRVGFGANNMGGTSFDYSFLNTGDSGVYFITHSSGNWYVRYRGVNAMTVEQQDYEVNTNVAVTNAWVRLDLEFTRVAGSPADLSIVAKINGATVSSILTSAVESSQGIELRGMLYHLCPFISAKKTLGGRARDLLVDSFTFYGEVTR